jgi:hypothetical protein
MIAASKVKGLDFDGLVGHAWWRASRPTPGISSDAGTSRFQLAAKAHPAKSQSTGPKRREPSQLLIDLHRRNRFRLSAPISRLFSRILCVIVFAIQIRSSIASFFLVELLSRSSTQLPFFAATDGLRFDSCSSE